MRSESGSTPGAGEPLAGLGLPPAGRGTTLGLLGLDAEEAAGGATGSGASGVGASDGVTGGGGAAAGVATSAGGLTAAAEVSGAGALPELEPFHAKRPITSTAPTPAKPNQTARLLRDTWVAPHACEPVLDAAVWALRLEEDSSVDDMPLELSTREMRSALRGPASGAKPAKSRASAPTFG